MGNQHSKADIAERFWSKVDRSGECWVWTAARIRGYGVFTISRARKNVRVPRLVWEWVRGPIPDGMVVRHTCDNPPCCNPAHLEIGTQADNLRDMSIRGRGRKGRGAMQRGEQMLVHDSGDVGAVVGA